MQTCCEWEDDEEKDTGKDAGVVQAAASMVTEMTPFRLLDFFRRPSIKAAKMLRFIPSRPSRRSFIELVADVPEHLRLGRGGKVLPCLYAGGRRKHEPFRTAARRL